MLLDNPFPAVTGLFPGRYAAGRRRRGVPRCPGSRRAPGNADACQPSACHPHHAQHNGQGSEGGLYVRTNFAYGLPRQDIYFRYALKATLIPLLTIIGLTPAAICWAAPSSPSMSSIGLASAATSSAPSCRSDYPAAVGVSFVSSRGLPVISLIVDLTYFFADPRLRASTLAAVKSGKTRAARRPAG